MQQKRNPNELTIVREFDAPRDLVFDCFANKEHMQAWWGPVEAKTTVLSMDFKPGGLFHFKMKFEETELNARFIYREIRRPDYIEFVLSVSDELANIIHAPFFENWPDEILNEISLEAIEDRTRLTQKSYPTNASDAEWASFVLNRQSFYDGTMATLDMLEILLIRLTQ